MSGLGRNGGGAGEGEALGDSDLPPLSVPKCHLSQERSDRSALCASEAHGDDPDSEQWSAIFLIVNRSFEIWRGLFHRLTSVIVHLSVTRNVGDSNCKDQTNVSEVTSIVSKLMASTNDGESRQFAHVSDGRTRRLSPVPTSHSIIQCNPDDTKK
jgi:hypothetical protein